MEIRERIRQIKKQITEIYDIDIQKKIAFLKQRYYEAGNKAAKILAYKLRKQQAERVVHKIKDPTTKQLKHKFQDILDTFKKYYQKLYARMDRTGVTPQNACFYHAVFPQSQKTTTKHYWQRQL